MTTPPRKLIETVIPLPEINDASEYDKMPGIAPHPKGIHHWWARLPREGLASSTETSNIRQSILKT